MIPRYKLKQAVIISKQARKSYPSGTIVILISRDKERIVVENHTTGKRFVTTESNLEAI
jgi:hypothetical protein